MSEMVERVAEVLVSLDVRKADMLYMDMARTIIEAMREPTAEMVQAANAFVAYDGEENNPEASTAWQAMIDAALKD